MSEPVRRLDPAASEATREANQGIAEKAVRLRFRARVPFICECIDPDCREFVLLRTDEYERVRAERAFITLPGHDAAAD